MNLNNILKAIQEESTDKVDNRRGLFKSFGSKVAMASLPLVAGSLFKTAKAQTTNELMEAMNLVLTYEQLGHAFYTMAVYQGPVFATNSGRTAFETILGQKAKHIEYLNTVITNAGGTPAVAPVFDLSGGEGSGTGPFAESMIDYRKMLALAQVIEDTTLRVQKGQITLLMVNDTFLSTMLGIHTVTARYASHVRLMRWEAGNAPVRPWITGTRSETENSYMHPYYAGEGQTVQSGVNMIGLNGQALDYDVVTEAFDEPVSKEVAAERLMPFIKP
jgi:hypothetical protein